MAADEPGDGALLAETRGRAEALRVRLERDRRDLAAASAAPAVSSVELDVAAEGLAALDRVIEAVAQVIAAVGREQDRE